MAMELCAYRDGRLENGLRFITPDKGGEDLYVHSTAVQNGPIKEGDKVELEIGQGDKGPRAENVSRK